MTHPDRLIDNTGENLADICSKLARDSRGVQDALDDNPISSDFYGALEQEVAELIEEASHRAEANERKTVMPQDL